MATLIMAWRNLWRNSRRTAITLAAVALNTAILILSFALIEGMLIQLGNNVTNLSMGHAQVHAEGYLDDRSIYKNIPDPGSILGAAEKASIDASPRSFGVGLIANRSKSAGATLWGVDPTAEARAFTLTERVTDGAFLGPEPKAEVVLGKKISRSLHAKLGDEIVALVQAADGSMGNELFKVVGILSGSGEDIDRAGVFLHQGDFERLFLTNGAVHEIALNTHNRMELEAIKPAMGALPEGAELKTWKELIPAFAKMMEMSDRSMWIIAFVFYLGAALGVMNTMLMATHDRVREFGVLKALGATPWRIIRDVSAEGWMISLVSTVLGAALGVAGSYYIQVHGIDLSNGSDLTVSGVAYDSIWYAKLTTKDVVSSVVSMWIICVVASLYPAVKAARLDAVRAMTHV